MKYMKCYKGISTSREQCWKSARRNELWFVKILTKCTFKTKTRIWVQISKPTEKAEDSYRLLQSQYRGGRDRQIPEMHRPASLADSMTFNFTERLSQK